MLRLLDRLERLGNALPDPLVLFALLAVGVALASGVADALGVHVTHPATGEDVHAVNLLTAAGLRRMLTEAVKNFAGFPPLGTVLVAMLGIGVAERTGLVGAALRAFVSAVPARGLTFAMMFAGVQSSLAADAGFVVLVPLGAALWASAGRHPLAGLSVAYTAVAGGYGANLLITSLDPLLAGLTQTGAQLVDPTHVVSPTANWWFNAVSALMLPFVGTWVSDRWVEPRFGTWTGAAEAAEAPDRGGLWAAGLTVAAFAALAALVAGTVLRDPSGGTTEWKPLYESVVVLVSLGFFLPGVAYGVTTGRIRSGADVAGLAAQAVASMGGYVVLAFAAAQFIAWFNWSNLGLILAVKGADGIAALGLGPGPLLTALVVVSGVLNLLIASASAKWAVLAPVFVPMGMLLGLSPELVQAAYRVGDAVTNGLTPLMPYIPVVLVVAGRYVPGTGLGTLLSAQVPPAIAFGICWLLLLLGWTAMGWPLGPGGGLTWAPPG